MSEDVLTVASQLGYIEDEQSDFGAMLFSQQPWTVWGWAFVHQWRRGQSPALPSGVTFPALCEEESGRKTTQAAPTPVLIDGGGPGHSHHTKPSHPNLSAACLEISI